MFFTIYCFNTFVRRVQLLQTGIKSFGLTFVLCRGTLWGFKYRYFLFMLKDYIAY